MQYVIRQGFSVENGGVVYTGGQTVDLSAAEFELHKHKFEGVPAPALPPQGNQSNNVTSLQISLLAETWTDFAEVSEVKEWQVLAEDGSDLTDSFEYRKFQTKWQIFSLLPQTNLQINF